MNLSWISRAVRTIPQGHVGRAEFLHPSKRYVQRLFQHTSSRGSNLPRLAQPSVWDSIIPKGLRRTHASRDGKKKATNPATYFIWIYILIGSQAIRIMGTKNDFVTFTRKADIKIAQLREVVEKLQQGQDVDVEKVLGSGAEAQELEWEEALRELQEQDRIWQNNAKKSREERERLAREEQDANPVSSSVDKTQGAEAPSVIPPHIPPPRPGFY
ncbi:hypothetical protein PV08_00650 [Exophiala spinifera]|uniref:Uncharacterized protein n=1 Tax=Exophiala spinifera TaxID=91928 RepID=A0A0D2BNH0_9EURO|nr:uncharacterized protein PV08_00650 [Exophiala spinifera]KIW20075.1 hypothetical protein PV08_00650 [Exophiala spinifera]